LEQAREACPGGTAFTLQLLDEVVAIVKAVGEAPSQEFANWAREQLTAKGSTLVSSMFRDVQRNRPIEVEQIIGDLLRRGAKAGIAAPLLSAAFVHLLVYRNKLAVA
jgi:2-dehydropantoate 2-reductase